MAKALRTIAVVAGAVALIATGIGAIGGAAFAATALGGTIASVATWAGVVAGVAGIGARLLTKPPPARGSVTETIIDIDAPSPYGMGEGYFGGVMRHRVGYGPTLKKVPNPFLFEVIALSVAGPIAGPITPQVDFGAVTSYYSGWLATDTRLGARPDTALTAPLQASPPGWSTAHKLSGTAAIAWNHKFDKDGKIYASGLPTRGVVAKWVLVYDPRKDSTRPGGSGAHRLGDETTYEWSENPALHAGTYAFGRYINDKRVIGVGLPDEGIDWEGIAAWANDCDANGWRMFGFVFEGAQDDAQRRWQNLRDICIAGGGEPLFSGAVLGFHWNRPRIALDTVTEADLADGPQEVTAMQSWRDRLNTLRPRYISPLHNWSMVQADQVQIESYLTEDGQERAEDIPFNFVKDVDQAAELAAYWLVNSRELTPITLTLMPRLRGYRPGECLRLELPELGLDHDAVILRRQFDPGSMTVTLTLVTEDPDKHAFALGRTGVAPPTPALTNSAEDRDTITREARAPFWPEVDGPGRPADDATRNVPMGTYDAGTTYLRGDNVIFSGSSYQLIVDESTGNDPPDALRWALVASAGSGTPGADGLEGLTIIVSNDSVTIPTDADGSGGDFSSAGGQMKLRRGATDLAPTFSIAAASPATSWISMNPTTGVYSVIDPSVNFATATLRATWAGVNYDKTYTVAKAPAGEPGPQGDDGAPGVSVAEFTIYRRAASAPATPSGGSLNFTTGALTPPSGWSSSIPAGNDPVYAARGFALTGTPGATVTPTWSGTNRAFQDGEAVDVIFRRSATQPATPAASSGVPSSWYADIASVPAGGDPIWSSFGSRSAPGVNWSWNVPVRVEGAQGDDGAPGVSVAEFTIYRRAASAPATPSGGSLNFTTGALTPPSGWSSSIPAGNDPVYAARGFALTGTPGATVTPTWSGTNRAFQDGEAVDVIFRRSATQPATPAASSGVPSSWYADIASVPAGGDPIWSSFGSRSAPGVNWSWNVPVRVEGAQGDDGAPGFSAQLTRETFTVPTDPGGLNGDYTQAGGAMILRSGADVVAPAFSIVSTSPANVGGSNLAGNPEAFNNWTGLSASVTANVATLDPLGGTAADKLFEGSTGTTTWARRLAIASRSAGTYIASIHFRAEERTFARIIYGTITSTQWFGATFDLATGTVTQQNAGAGGSVLGAGITSVGNGWYRAYVWGTVAGGTQTHYLYAQPVLNGTPAPVAATGMVSYTGVTNSGLLAFGAMVQAGDTLALYAPWITFNATTGLYTVRDPYALTATAVLRATFGGVDYDRNYSLAKAPRGTDGENGEPGAAAVSGFLTNDPIQLFAYANGAVASYTGATGSFRVYQGDDDVSANFSLSTLANPQSLTVNYSGQTYTVTGGLDNNEDTASLTILGTGAGAFAGVTIEKVLTVTKAKGGYEIVATLPTTNLFEGRVVFLTTDDKLYRYTGTAWTAAVPAVDISGQLADAQIAALAASKVTGQLTDTQIAALAAAKLTGQITQTQITDASISTSKLAATAVTADKIAASAVVADKIASNAVTAVKIQAGSVEAAKIAAGAVEADKIAANAVIAGKIAANAVTATQIASNAITADKINAGAVTAAKINVTSLTAITANIGEATAGIIRNASGSHRFDLNTGRIIFDNGTHIKASGVGFGTSNQFLEWFGPRPTGGNLALCSEANAIQYLKTNGDAYFGGSLSAGILRNAAQSSDIGAAASVTIGPFGSNGDPIQVITSYSVESSLVADYPGTSGGQADWEAAVTAWGATPGLFVNTSKSISCSVVVRVNRTVSGVTTTNWGTLTITGGIETLVGQRPVPGDSDGYLTYVRTVSGSITSTDNAGGTADRTFVATITTRTNAINGTVTFQRTGVIATEE
jgi:hypothetical protein